VHEQDNQPGEITYLVEVVREETATVEVVHGGEDSPAGREAARQEALTRVNGGEAVAWAAVGDPVAVAVAVQPEPAAV
jgi:hypothetical protein